MNFNNDVQCYHDHGLYHPSTLSFTAFLTLVVKGHAIFHSLSILALIYYVLEFAVSVMSF